MAWKKSLGLLVVLALMGGPAYAQEALAPQTQNGVSFVSGGIGEEGRTAMRQARADYNLQLLFAMQGSGEYLSDVKVKIMDRQGNTLVDAVADGPFFLAQMKPGTYQVTAESGGHTRKVSVTIGEKGAVSESFYWPTGG